MSRFKIKQKQLSHKHIHYNVYFDLFQDAVVNKSLSCLRESASELDNIYTTALLAYVFTLTRDMETRAQLLEQLDKVSLKDGESPS